VDLDNITYCSAPMADSVVHQERAKDATIMIIDADFYALDHGACEGPTTSMGRLTLNVLLSFARFAREVTSERIRDKIGASKRKGWEAWCRWAM
jgi:DNA invertase Pin-like site-specific DNA recombinase